MSAFARSAANASRRLRTSSSVGAFSRGRGRPCARSHRYSPLCGCKVGCPSSCRRRFTPISIRTSEGSRSPRYMAPVCCSARSLDADRRGKVLIRSDSGGSNDDAEQHSGARSAHRPRMKRESLPFRPSGQGFPSQTGRARCPHSGQNPTSPAAARQSPSIKLLRRTLLGACAVGKLTTICSSIRSFVPTTYGV